MSSPFKVAVVQSSSVVFEPKATLAKVRELTANAAKGGAKLVVFPEAFVSAYPKGLDFGARVGMRTAQGRDDFLVTEIDPADISRGKYDFDVVGHYARPDVFRLHVNEKPAPPVVLD